MSKQKTCLLVAVACLLASFWLSEYVRQPLLRWILPREASYQASLGVHDVFDAYLRFSGAFGVALAALPIAAYCSRNGRQLVVAITLGLLAATLTALTLRSYIHWQLEFSLGLLPVTPGVAPDQVRLELIPLAASFTIVATTLVWRLRQREETQQAIEES